ncbi:transglutaminase-like domain-containing protein [Foetidibacter luteolus]|uniref:transglutaminase-like domain-containing protein n=1 Tax=Foetidibacter luteolus TaxID=2608880 RepID=UPI00129A393D|nr:transglutaminase family protein [Foetidibacter luteolus]
MKFKVSSELEYQVLMPSTFIFNIQVSKASSQKVIEESLVVNPQLPVEEFISATGDARFIRIRIKKPTTFSINYQATVDTRHIILDEKRHSDEVPVDKLDTDVIPYLFPSRYCQSDRIQKLAFKEFGDIDNLYLKVLAITEWIYNNVEYLSGSTNASTSAIDTITERAGVCRDFAHLGIALCRALSIPARYYTGYAYQLVPQDFHACFEAYIGGNWIFFDPTKLVPLNGLVKIANGRDAADAAVASIYGNTICNKMVVNCECLEKEFNPYHYEESKQEGLSYQ